MNKERQSLNTLLLYQNCSTDNPSSRFT